MAAAEKALARQKFVTPLDVCLNIGWLQPSNVEDWRRGRVDDLDYFLPTHDDRSVAFLVHLQKWAIAKGLKPFEADYVSAARSRRPLRFTSLDEPLLEQAWRTHWMSPDLPDKQAERVIERQSAPPDLVVIQPVKDFTCAECGDGSGELLTMDAEAISRHAGLRGSGRVGRSADGRALDERAIALAVVASIRHQDTDYDELLMSGTARADARTQIKPAIDRVLAAWSAADAR